MYMYVFIGEMCIIKVIKSFMFIKKLKKYKLLNKNIVDIIFLSFL